MTYHISSPSHYNVEQSVVVKGLNVLAFDIVVIELNNRFHYNLLFVVNIHHFDVVVIHIVQMIDHNPSLLVIPYSLFTHTGTYKTEHNNNTQ